MFAIIFNVELISIVLGLGAMALPVVCMVRRGSRVLGCWQLFPHHAGGDVPLFLLAALWSRTWPRWRTPPTPGFWRAMVLLVCTAVLNLAAFLLARRRAHK